MATSRSCTKPPGSGKAAGSPLHAALPCPAIAAPPPLTRVFGDLERSTCEDPSRENRATWKGKGSVEGALVGKGNAWDIPDTGIGGLLSAPEVKADVSCKSAASGGTHPGVPTPTLWCKWVASLRKPPQKFLIEYHRLPLKKKMQNYCKYIKPGSSFALQSGDKN